MKYTVENKIAIPPRVRTGGRRRDPLSLIGQITAIKKGQSILVDDRNRNTCLRAAHTAGKRTGHTFTSRTMDGGVRIWRVS